MRRRRFLYAIVAGLGLTAGCIDGGSEPAQSPSTPTEPPPDTLATTNHPRTTTTDRPLTTTEMTTTVPLAQTSEPDSETSTHSESKRMGTEVETITTQTESATTTSEISTETSQGGLSTQNSKMTDCRGREYNQISSPTSENINLELRPQTSDASTLTRESVRITATGDLPVNLRGHKLEYSTGQELSLEKTLVPDEEIFIMSQGTTSGGMDSCPPKHVRPADFDTLVLRGGSTTVKIVGPSGETVVQKMSNGTTSI